MDRVIIYPGQIPLETDLLQTNKNAMIALSKLAAALLGASTMVSGLAVTPTGPASLSVLVAPGEIYSSQNVDGTAYSSIAADTAHQIVKQGISMDSRSLSCPAPATSGQSINYLVQASYADTDSGSVVLPYYNASNPAIAYSGPNNTGTAQTTLRQGLVAISAKAGIAAATGSQTTPAPDAGYVGLYTVNVANGQTTINAGNISQFAGAPIINSTLHGQAPAFSIPLLVANATATGHALNLGQADARYAPLAGAGNQVGEVFDWPVASTPVYGILCNGAAVSSTVYSALFAKMVRSKAGATISIASPGVVGWVGHGLAANGPVKFSTTGTLPTGLVAGTTYYVIAAGLTADAFQLSATVGGAAIATTGAQSGVHTAINAPWGCANDLSTFNVPNIPADYTTVQALGNEGTSTVGQVIAHTHPIGYSTINTGGGIGGFSPVNSSDATGATGGSANLAAGVRMRKYIRFA